MDRVTSLGLALLLLGGSTSRAEAQERRPATLTAVRDATVVRRSVQGTPVVPVVRGLPLELGYVLRTNPSGLAEALFRDGRHVKLATSSALEISPTRADRLRVLQGKVWVRVPPRTGLQIDGLAANCRVTGTELQLEVAEDGTTTVTVVEGEVRFANPQGEVVVREAQQSTARQGQAPTTPVVAANLPVLLEWTNELQPVALLLEVSYVSQDPRQLQAALREAEALPPGPERLQRLGDVRHDRGELTEALTTYQQALAALGEAAPAPARAALLARLGQTWLELGKPPEAERQFTQALALDPSHTPARTGLVMVRLSQDQNEVALETAREAVQRDERAPAAHLVLALALIRAGQRDAALQALEQALRLDPNEAQALAWRSFLLRAGERLEEAQQAAQAAVVVAPHSSLAQQALADSLFALGRNREARRAAERAVALNPLSPGARVSLGRALLQAGNVEGALREATKAVALDPNLERARHFRGVSLAQQRRLAAAARELERAIEMDPGYLEARAFLARVYQLQGRSGAAVDVVQEAIKQNPQFAPAHAALGRVYWRAGRLREAEAAYRRALALSPGSVVYRIELARVNLDQNNLPDALAAALEAVARAPGSSEAHAVLGLVYDRRGSPDQALREYRAALSLWSENSLAHLGLGTSSPSGGERVREIRRVLTGAPPVSYSEADTGESLREVAQAILRDPPVLAEIFKPGVTTEITPGAGTDAARSISSTHRQQYLRGNLFDLTLGNHEQSENYRNDRHEEWTFGWLNLAGTPHYRTQVLGQYAHTGREKVLPGSVTGPTPNGRSSFWDNSWDLSLRHRLAPQTYLWWRASTQRSTTNSQDPDTVEERFDLLNTPTVLSRTRHGRLGVEGRVDQRWGTGHTFTYNLFAGRNYVDNQQLSFQRSTLGFDQMLDIFVRDRLVAHTFQYSYQPRKRFSLILGATAQRYTASFWLQQPGEVVQRGEDTSERRWQPFGYATYVLSQRDVVRLIGHRRREHGFRPLLQPAEAFVVDEFPTLEEGGQSMTLELDYERRFSPRSFAKLFLFQSVIENFFVFPSISQVGNAFLLDEPRGTALYPLGFLVPDARSRGIGVRYEHQLSPFLAGYLRYTYRALTDETACTPAERAAGFCMPPGRQLPLNPRSRVVLGLNYIDRAGTKLLAEADWSAGQYIGVTRRAEWMKLPSKLLVNLRIGRERTVRREWTFSITNLLNAGTTLWPGFPGPGRTLRLQYSFRF